MIRLGLLGAGRIGMAHARAYPALEKVRLVAVADVDRAAAQRIARAHGARVYTTVEDLLGDEEVDAVDVCLPTFLHETAVVGAAGAGKHVLCEKPIARTLTEVDRMIEAVERTGVKAMVAQVVRFWPEYAMIKSLLDAGRLGRPLMAMATRLEAVTRFSGWFRDISLSGGTLLDLHVHDLDYLFHLFGEPRSVYAVGVSETGIGTWDHVVTTLDYGELKAVAEGSYLMPPEFAFTQAFRLLGSEGYAEYRRAGTVEEEAVEEHRLVVYQGNRSPIYPACPDKDAYLAEIEYFVDCVAQDRPVKIATLAEARVVLQIALAARESLETGRVIPFSGHQEGM